MKIKLYRQRGMKPRRRPKGRELRFSPLGIPHGLAPAASRGVILVKHYLFICFFLVNSCFATAKFEASITSIPANIQQKMRNSSWHTGCPVPLSQLAYIKLSYWGFDNRAHQGVLIINKQRANDIVNIFAGLFRAKFPIQLMQPAYLFHGNDDAMMNANDTSAFNCRLMTGMTNMYSLHSYGWAIDINPIQNPYIANKGKVILPPSSKQFLDRHIYRTGMIMHNGIVYRLFKRYGWTWGGNWPKRYSVKDYQHFQLSASSPI